MNAHGITVLRRDRRLRFFWQTNVSSFHEFDVTSINDNGDRILLFLKLKSWDSCRLTVLSLCLRVWWYIRYRVWRRGNMNGAVFVTDVLMTRDWKDWWRRESEVDWRTNRSDHDVSVFTWSFRGCGGAVAEQAVRVIVGSIVGSDVKREANTIYGWRYVIRDSREDNFIGDISYGSDENRIARASRRRARETGSWTDSFVAKTEHDDDRYLDLLGSERCDMFRSFYTCRYFVWENVSVNRLARLLISGESCSVDGLSDVMRRKRTSMTHVILIYGNMVLYLISWEIEWWATWFDEIESLSPQDQKSYWSVLLSSFLNHKICVQKNPLFSYGERFLISIFMTFGWVINETFHRTFYFDFKKSEWYFQYWLQFI